jgi:hypothetical protein
LVNFHKANAAMTAFSPDEYLQLKTFEERKAYCLAHQDKRIPLPVDDFQWDYEKQNSYTNAELGE